MSGLNGIGVAISGGGYRASMWGLGALMYLVDAGAAKDVVSIASVSGGSITNGVVAQQVPDLRTCTPDGFDAAMTPFVGRVADVGLFPLAKPTRAYTLGLAADTVLALAATVGGFVTLVRGGWDAGTTWWAIVAAVLWAVALWAFEQRSRVADRALARTEFATAGRPTLLAEVDRPTQHVFCATELQESHQLYLSPRFVYSWAHGTGTPGDLRLSTAVQASACFPGGFRPRRLRATRFGFVRREGESGAALQWVVLTDGGVYDNMSEQWLATTSLRAPTPQQGVQPGPMVQTLLVVNASALKPPKALPDGGPWGEVVDLLATMDVMYGQTTSVRRYDLVALWELRATAGKGQVGALVNIGQDPLAAARGLARHPSWAHTPAEQARVARAEKAVAALVDAGVDWAGLQEQNASVGTVLSALGQGVSLRLVYGGYVTAVVNAFVLLDLPWVDIPEPDAFGRRVGLVAAGAVPRVAASASRAPVSPAGP